MMYNNEEVGNPVHFPSRHDRFEFDEEVAAIFDNMAIRSIPLYREAHTVHAMLAQTHIIYQLNVLHRRHVNVLDIGASTGGFARELCNRFQVDPKLGIDRVNYHATDASDAMIEQFKHAFPWATAVVCGADTPTGMTDGIDIVCLMYVLQFIPEDQRTDILKGVYRAMRPGAILFLGQKVTLDDSIKSVFAWEYIQWRMANGYSKEEIAAKTRALESVMWTETLEQTIARLREVGFTYIRTTTQWLQFSTLMARK